MTRTATRLLAGAYLSFLVVLGGAVGPAWGAVDRVASVTVNVWPEYDVAQGLVLVSFQLSAQTPLPQTLDVPIPKGAKLNWVGELYAPKTQDKAIQSTTIRGKTEDAVRFTVTGSRSVQYEYYQPTLEVKGQRRSYVLRYRIPFDATRVQLLFQVPKAAATFTVRPAAQREEVSPEGFTNKIVDLLDVRRGQVLTYRIAYTNVTGQLSKPPGAAGTANPGQQGIGGSSGPAGAVTTLQMLVVVAAIAVAAGVVLFGMRPRPPAVEPPAKAQRKPPVRRAGGVPSKAGAASARGATGSVKRRPAKAAEDETAEDDPFDLTEPD